MQTDDGVRYDGSYASVKAVLWWACGLLTVKADGVDPPDALRLDFWDDRGVFVGAVVCHPGDRLFRGPDGEIVVMAERK